MRALREQGTSRETFERVRDRRRALEEAVENGADEGTLRQLAFDYGEAEGDAAVERARMHARVMEILTPEQRQQYQTLREEQKQKMEERRERMRERRDNRRDPNPDSF
jgi:Spy/CpxP family protein refolding chaperone